MSNAALPLSLLKAGLQRGSELTPAPRPQEAPWTYQGLLGRLALFTGTGRVSAAVQLIAQAQQHKEPCAWIVEKGFEPFAPDLQASGVALDSLMLIRLKEHPQLARAADLLARTGGVGLVIIDSRSLPSKGALKRLANHAQRHHMSAVILSDQAHTAHAFSLVARAAPNEHKAQHIRALKDRLNPALWNHSEPYHDVPGCP